MAIMITRITTFIWEVLVDIAEAKQARMKRQGYSMWY
jgi:hypothetical protein